MRIVYSSDLHGSLKQYQDLYKAAVGYKADVVLIGGDLFPKGKTKNPVNQYEYFVQSISPIIHKSTQENQYPKHTYIILGNADFSSNMDEFKAHAKNMKTFTFVNAEIVRLLESEYYLFGYSFVNLSPHGTKDWEKVDLTDLSSDAHRLDFCLKGRVSKGNEIVPIMIDLDTARLESIEHDLSTIFNKTESLPCPLNKMVWMIHCPPFETPLDLMKGKRHCGSTAIKQAIQKRQPLISLHGHIHETVELSKSFNTQLGKSMSFSSGNQWKENIQYLSIDLSDPSSATRRQWNDK